MSDRGRRRGAEEAECRTRNSKVSWPASLSDSLCHDQYVPRVVSLAGMLFPAAQAIFYTVSSAACTFLSRLISFSTSKPSLSERDFHAVIKSGVNEHMCLRGARKGVSLKKKKKKQTTNKNSAAGMSPGNIFHFAPLV